MFSFLIIASIFLTVIIGFKFRINVGLIALAFAYFWGCLILGNPPGAIFKAWPLSLFFFILTSTFFYGLAVTNGTLAIVSSHILYRFRKIPWIIPLVMWFINFGIAGLGPGPSAVVAFMPNIIMPIAEKMQLHKMIVVTVIVGAGVAGGYTPISFCYATLKTPLQIMGLSEAQQLALLTPASHNVILAEFLIFLVTYIIFRGWKVKKLDSLAKPAPLTTQQLHTTILIAVSLVFLILFPFAHNFFPDHPTITHLYKATNPALIFIVMLVLGLILKLGDQRKAQDFVPWGTIITVCGMGTLVTVVQRAGAIDFLSAWLSSNMSPLLCKAAVAVICGFTSFFSSTLAVTIPSMTPVVLGIAANTGISAVALVSAVIIGGHFAGVAPFSNGGAMIMASESQPEKRDTLFLQLIALALGSICFASLLTVLGVFG